MIYKLIFKQLRSIATDFLKKIYEKLAFFSGILAYLTNNKPIWGFSAK